jgi:hypothetical protein
MCNQGLGVLHIQRTCIVVLRALPILLPILLVSIILVFTDQGRGFLSILENGFLALPLGILGLIAGFFCYQLAPRIRGADGPAVRGEVCEAGAGFEHIALRFWYAQWSGSLIAGAVAAVLIPCFIEVYLGSSVSQSIPTRTRDELYGSVRNTALLSSVLLFAIMLLRRQISLIGVEKKDEPKSWFGLIYVIVLLVLYGGFSIANKFFWGYAVCFVSSLLILASFLIPPLFSTPADPYSDKLPSRWAILLAAACVVLGVALNFWPAVLTMSGSVISSVIALTALIAAFVLLEWGWLGLYRRGPLFVRPVTGLLIIALLALLGAGLFTARPVRELAAATIAPPTTEPPSAKPSKVPPRRETLGAYVQHWLNDRLADVKRPIAGDDRPYPVFIVAAPGGGIRAAYWTAGILSALQDANGNFARHVLAISSVSGGSVGAGIFAALVKSGCHPSSGGAPAAAPTSACRESAANILATDLLAPTVYSMLSRDLLGGIFSSLPDRAAALEQAIEDAGFAAMQKEILTQPFDAMWDQASRATVPGVFFNVTDVNSAGRLVLGPASMTGGESQQTLEAKVFRLSTAMVLGARFPYISPEGFVASGTSPNGDTGRLRLVDGGLSDNSGLETILSIVKAVTAAKPPSPIKVYVLNIENSPLSTTTLKDAGAFRAPFALYARMVAGLAEKSKQQAKCEINATKDAVMLDDVRPNGEKSVFLLGWTLPLSVRDDMNTQISALLQLGQGPLARVLAELAPPAATSPQQAAPAVAPDTGCPARKT